MPFRCAWLTFLFLSNSSTLTGAAYAVVQGDALAFTPPGVFCYKLSGQEENLTSCRVSSSAREEGP